MTDTKGAQPEQLVKDVDRIRAALRYYLPDGENQMAALNALDALATALSECRERERVLREALTLIAEGRWASRGGYSHGTIGARECARAALAAQPPSEASERSGM